MTEFNELSREVAEFASKLGFVDNPNPYSEFHPKEAKRTPGNPGKKTKDKKRNSGKNLDQRKSIQTSQSRKLKTKNDHYDKEALLRILSGPQEKSTADLKRTYKHEISVCYLWILGLKKAKSILSGSAPILWHVALEDLSELATEKNDQEEILSPAEIQQRKLEASILAQNEKDAYDYRLHSSKKHGKWLLQIREKGTHADKIAALSLQIRDAVIANVSELDVLLNIAEKQKGSKDLVISALKALTELFRCFLLPDRKLISFDQRPFKVLNENQQQSKLRLLYWFIEDLVKVKYARFVSILESATMAPLDHLRSEAVTMVSNLLYEKPEQEGQLLRILIHKLGEKTKKTGSKVAFLISQLIIKHPRMKSVVLREAEKFVFLSGTTIRSIHRVLQVFNLINYEHTDSDKSAATKYINLCFTLFQLLVDGKIGSTVDLEHKFETKSPVHKRPRQMARAKPKEKGKVQEIDATVFNALVIGIRRSLPFADQKELGGLIEKHLDALFRIIHIAPLGVGIQVISLLLQVANSTTNAIDRLYRAIYEKILDPHLSETRKLPLFISTVFKALKQDSVLARTTAFVKRILQVAINTEPHIHTAFLLLVSELMKFKPGLKNGILQAEDSDEREYKIDSREPKFSGAGDVCYWELPLSLVHYHPVVQSASSELLSTQSISSRGDPLQELTLFAFLEKLATGKEPKLKSIGFGNDPQTTPGASLHHRVIESKTLFASLASQEVPVEDVFFHKYFNLQGVKKDRQMRQHVKQRKKGKLQMDSEGILTEDEDELESLGDSEFEDMETNATDFDQMFNGGPKRHTSKPPAELYDYSALVEDLEEAYRDEEENDDKEEDDVEEEEEDEDDDNDVEEDYEESEEDVDLPTLQFPELDSTSEEESEVAPTRKRVKKRKLDSDFAPVEEFADVLESD